MSLSLWKKEDGAHPFSHVFPGFFASYTLLGRQPLPRLSPCTMSLALSTFVSQSRQWAHDSPKPAGPPGILLAHLYILSRDQMTRPPGNGFFLGTRAFRMRHFALPRLFARLSPSAGSLLHPYWGLRLTNPGSWLSPCPTLDRGLAWPSWATKEHPLGLLSLSSSQVPL